MDYGNNDYEPRRSGSFSRIGSTNSSLRRHSFNQLGAGPHEVDDDSDRRSVSEAGDIGDRALHSQRHSGSGRQFYVQELSFKESQLPDVSPASPDAILHTNEQNKECEMELPWFVTYISSHIHLAMLGILGVGSFLMGWLGVVYKANISKFSPELAVGLTTGFVGSLTTFSGWNQKMLELSVNEHWVFSVLGFLLGLFLVAYSFIFGVESAKGFKWVFDKTNLSSKCDFPKINNIIYQSILIVVMITMLGFLWGVSVALLKKDFNGDSSTSHLWFGCLVGPIGVWLRFYLAQYNGQGLGRSEMMKWMPFGTLVANVSAACIMAAFATMKKAVTNKSFDIVASGIQFGLCGCLSTVSTFIAELGAMRESRHPWRVYVYALTTIIILFIFGTLIYSVPVWTNDWP